RPTGGGGGQGGGGAAPPLRLDRLGYDAQGRLRAGGAHHATASDGELAGYLDQARRLLGARPPPGGGGREALSQLGRGDRAAEQVALADPAAQERSRSAWAGVSTPSATTSRPRLWAMATMA